MIRIEITLDKYFSLGGKFKRLNWNETYGHHNGLKIIDASKTYELNDRGEELYKFIFEGDVIMILHPSKIKFFVNVNLDERYK